MEPHDAPDATPPATERRRFVMGASTFRPMEAAYAPSLQIDPFMTGPVWRFGSPPSKLLGSVPISSGCRVIELHTHYQKGYFDGGFFGAVLYRRAAMDLPVIAAAFEDLSAGAGDSRIAKLTPLYQSEQDEEIFLVVTGSSPAQSITYATGVMDCERN